MSDLFPPALTEDHLRLAEALIFSSAEPVPARTLAALLPEDIEAETVLRALQERYAGRGVELAEIGLGWQFRSAPDLAPRLTRLISRPRRLPRAAMETLAIIAWHQPVTRAQIETIRGATLSQQTLDSLLEASLIRSAGHREVPGRPTLWGDNAGLSRSVRLEGSRGPAEARGSGDRTRRVGTNSQMRSLWRGADPGFLASLARARTPACSTSTGPKSH